MMRALMTQRLSVSITATHRKPIQCRIVFKLAKAFEECLCF